MKKYCGVCSDGDQWDFIEKYGCYHPSCNDFEEYMKINDCYGIFQEDIDKYIREILAAMSGKVDYKIEHGPVYDTIIIND